MCSGMLHNLFSLTFHFQSVKVHGELFGPWAGLDRRRPMAEQTHASRPVYDSVHSFLAGQHWPGYFLFRIGDAQT